jgi:hypothetical protein
MLDHIRSSLNADGVSFSNAMVSVLANRIEEGWMTLRYGRDLAWPSNDSVCRRVGVHAGKGDGVWLCKGFLEELYCNASCCDIVGSRSNLIRVRSKIRGLI